MTVFNEADNIKMVLESFNSQTRLPDELIIVDGGSTDGTPAIIQTFMSAGSAKYPLELILRPGSNISEGRNLAIKSASFELVAGVDAGIKLPPDWLENISAPFFNSQEEIQVVAGFFKADPEPSSPFQIAMGAAVLPVEREIKPEKFLPSSRSVAFTRKAWEQAGGYPEWLDYCEDLVFDLNLKRLGYKFFWQPEAWVYFAPRKNLKAFFKQYFRYARGDGKAGLFPERHALRYFTYLIFIPVMLRTALKNGPGAFVLILAILAYLRTPFRRLFSSFYFFQLDFLQKLICGGYIPLIKLTGDLAKMAGYPPGVVWRLARRNDI